MRPQSNKELADLIINWVRQHGQTNGSPLPEITEHTNLMDSGLLDSLGFVELILYVESQTGRAVDLADVEPEEFSVVKGLCEIAMRNHA